MTEVSVEEQIKWIYATDEITAPFDHLVGVLELRLKDNKIVDITEDFLVLMLLKPQITRQLHLASARTVDYYYEAIKTGDPTLVREVGFFIKRKDPGEFFATVAPAKPAAYDLPMPKIETVEDYECQTMVMVHTHPPMGDVLAPSIIEQRKARNSGLEYVGDLYAFWAMRRFGREDIGKNGRMGPEFIGRPLSIILQDDFKTETTKLLFIRESEALIALSEQEYIRELRNSKRKFFMKDEYKVQKFLADLGYQSSYLEVPISQFYDYPLLYPNHINQVVKDLEI